MIVNGIASAGTGISITSMLVEVAVEKNHENRELLKKPVQQVGAEKVTKTDSDSEKQFTSSSAEAEEDKTQSDPKLGGSVDVSV